MADLRGRLPAPWNDRQRRALTALLIGATVALGAVAFRRPLFLADPPPPDAPRGGDLADRVDPNDADEATLAALPSIGPGRARDIVAYRDRAKDRDATETPFRTPTDLRRVKGIGRATVEAVAPYLKFPDDAP